MPRSRRPSFLTKQKEQQRRAKATEKREARRARRAQRKAGGDAEEAVPGNEPEETQPQVE
jgi:hypothetical protein